MRTESLQNLDHARMKIAVDLAALDAVFDIRLDPILHLCVRCRRRDESSVTRAPVQNNSSAAMAAEFFAPITATSWL